MILALIFSVASWAAEVVNINTASADELAAALKGVGPSKAEAIINYRETNGAFKHIDELVNVKGIGVRTVDLNREFISLDSDTAAKPDRD
jgi:competence protein ComEA